MDQAMHWGLTARNPNELVSPPRPVRREMTALTGSQFWQLLRLTEGSRWYPLWVLLGTSGLRVGEALGLLWTDVDLDAGRLAVRDKHPNVVAWLERNPRITLHFTPTSGSWLNMVEIFFGIITRQAIRRGTHRSVRELVEAIGRFIDGWNDRCETFVWTKTADEILTHARSGPRTSFTRRQPHGQPGESGEDASLAPTGSTRASLGRCCLRHVP